MTVSPSTAGLVLTRMLARSPMPVKFHSSVPSEPDRQNTRPSLVTAKTRSAVAVGEARSGEPRLFSQSFLPLFASNATTVPKPVAA